MGYGFLLSEVSPWMQAHVDLMKLNSNDPIMNKTQLESVSLIENKIIIKLISSATRDTSSYELTGELTTKAQWRMNMSAWV